LLKPIKQKMMGWHSVKVSPADTVFSRLVRLRDKQCVLCGRKGTGEEGIYGLQASHFYSRRKWAVRYDVDNVWSLCIGCHKKSHQDITEFEDFVLEKLGQKSFNLLTLRAWSKSPLGSAYWKNLTKKQAETIFFPLLGIMER